MKKKLITIPELYCGELNQQNNWTKICRNYQLTKEIIDEFKSKIYWNIIAQYQDEKIIEEFINKLDWYYISKNNKLSLEFLRKYKNKICFLEYIKYKKCNEEFITEFFDINSPIPEDWELIFKHCKLSESFIKENINKGYLKLNIKVICLHQNLSEEFIKKELIPIINNIYNNTNEWNYICQGQQLSESIIREYISNFDYRWETLIHSQKHLSLKFFREFEYKIPWDLIKNDPHLSKEFREEFKDKLI